MDQLAVVVDVDAVVAPEVVEVDMVQDSSNRVMVVVTDRVHMETKVVMETRVDMINLVVMAIKVAMVLEDMDKTNNTPQLTLHSSKEVMGVMVVQTIMVQLPKLVDKDMHLTN